jgi:hypothetical protein
VVGKKDMAYFDAARRNSGKEFKTPLELIREKHRDAPQEIAAEDPVLVGDLSRAARRDAERGYDVRICP